MRFGTIVLGIVIPLSTLCAGNAWSHGGGRGGSAPKSPHYNPPTPPHISQATQPHYNPQKAPQANHANFPEYSQQGSSNVYRSRASQRLANSKLANSGSGRIKPDVHIGQVGSTRSQGATTANVKAGTNSIGSPTPGSTGVSPSTTSQTPASTSPASTGSLATSVGTNPRTSAAITPTTGAVSIGSSNPNTISTVASVGTTNLNATPTTANPGSGRTMLSNLANGSGTTNLSYHPRRYYGYGSVYGNRGIRNTNYFGQMRALSRLINDLNQLSRGSVVNGNHTTRIRSDLMGVVSATGRPPIQTVHQLSMSLVNALPSRTVPMMNTGQLARDLAVVMNGNGMNVMQIQHAIGNAQSVLHSSGVSQPGIQSVTHGLMMVASWGNAASPLARTR